MPVAEIHPLEDVAEDDDFFAGDCFVACINGQVVGLCASNHPSFLGCTYLRLIGGKVSASGL